MRSTGSGNEPGSDVYGAIVSVRLERDKVLFVYKEEPNDTTAKTNNGNQVKDEEEQKDGAALSPVKWSEEPIRDCLEMSARQ